MLTVFFGVAYAALGLITSYLVGLTASALVHRRWECRPINPRTRFAVVIPAHDEAVVIASTLESIVDSTYPVDRYAVHVIADNCADHTAEIARTFASALDLTVHERHDALRCGKGYAIDWLLRRLAVDRTFDAYLFLDADWTVGSNVLDVVNTYLAAGADAVQVRCRVAHPESSWPASLRSLAFALVNYVRPLGLDGLGLSCGLKGTGMAFRRATLEDVGWKSYSLVEDVEQHIRLVNARRRVTFAPEATIESRMPDTLSDARSQNVRWESGKVALARQHALPLLREGFLRGNASAIAELFGLLTPPLSLLIAWCLAVEALAVLLGRRGFATLGGIFLVGIASHVVVGITFLEPSPRELRSLFYAPVYIAWKARVFARALAERGRGPWIRTPRSGEGMS